MILSRVIHVPSYSRTMKSFACILLVALAATGVYGDEAESLLGGKGVPITKHPHIVSIRLNGDHKCGGAIISPYHIITAAHCIEPFSKSPETIKNLTVVSGASSLRFGGATHKVAAMYYHPKYSTPGKPWTGHDVGIYKLAEPIKFSDRAKAIALPTSDIPEDIEVTVAGWGVTETGFLSTDLQDLTVYTVGLEECREMEMTRVVDYEFCTFLIPGQGTCQGDSGSPVVYEGKIVGVVSWGIPCALGYPDVHTNLFRVRDWIDEILAQ